MRDSENSISGPLSGFEVGSEVGVSEWLTVTQDMISDFGRNTLDPDPQHDNPDWAKEKSPFGHTIAYGFQTMSLLSFLLHSALKKPEPSTAPDGSFALNYGFDRLRLVTPVPVNSRIRGRFILDDVTKDAQGRIIQRLGTTVEIDGSKRPALVAEWLFMWLPASDAAGA